MRALERAHKVNARVIIIFIAVRLAGISDTPKLKRAARYECLTMHDISACALEPGHNGIFLCFFNPTLISAEVCEDVLLLLKHEGYATCCLNKCAKRVAKLVRLVVVPRHLMPPIVDLMESIVGQGYRTSSTIAREVISK
jgi:hypothetical protein